MLREKEVKGKSGWTLKIPSFPTNLRQHYKKKVITVASGKVCSFKLALLNLVITAIELL